MNLTDDEIRVKVAEADGWTYHGHSPELRVEAIACWTPEGREFDPMSLVLLPDYLHDLNAALTLCDRLRSEGWNIMIVSGEEMWGCSAANDSSNQWEFEKDPSAARAICLAFLKVKDSIASSP